MTFKKILRACLAPWPLDHGIMTQYSASKAHQDNQINRPSSIPLSSSQTATRAGRKSGGRTMATMSLAAASPLVSTPRGVAAPAPRTAFLGLRTADAPATRFFSGLAASPVPAGRGATAALVPMAKREQELEEIRSMSTEKLEEEVVDLKGELFLLRLKRSARQEFKNSEFSRMRKRIARMLTVKREREIEQGINKRLSRKLDRKWKQSIVVRPPPSLRENKEE